MVASSFADYPGSIDTDFGGGGEDWVGLGCNYYVCGYIFFDSRFLCS